MVEKGYQFESTVTKKKYHTKFSLDRNSFCAVYLLACKVFLKQYIGSTAARFRLRFKQYRSNIKLLGKGRREFKEEKLIENFFLYSHKETHEDKLKSCYGNCKNQNQIFQSSAKVMQNL